MAKTMSKKVTGFHAGITVTDETEIVHHIAQQLEALARVLTRVETNGEDQKPIKTEDFVCIMQVFQEKLESLEDLAGAVHATADEMLHPIPKAVRMAEEAASS